MADLQRSGGVFIDKPTPAPDPDNPEPGLRIRHHVPRNHQASVKRPCVWCGQPTDILAETPFTPDLGFLPLMLTCGAHMRIVYRMLQDGQPIDAWETGAVARLTSLALPRVSDGRRTRLLILSSHSILEYDDLRLFTDLGYDTFIIGGYQDPRNPGEGLRPALPDAPYHPELIELAEVQRRKHEGQRTDLSIIDWAKADLHPDLIEWADIIMVNCFPETWIAGQWDRIRHKRVVWRTIGQSSPWTETEMRPLHEQGLEVVRYSPAERRAFEPLGCFAGEDAMIRFAKYPSDFPAWVGDNAVVGNVTQNLDLRGDHCGYDFWQEATRGLPTMPSGQGSERLPNGTGTLSYTGLLDYLSHLRCYLFMGTQPASYTLSLMEAMLAGVPVVSIGPDEMWMPLLFEGHELVGQTAENGWPDWSAAEARGTLQLFLNSHMDAEQWSLLMRENAVRLFSAANVGPQWLDFLGNPNPVRLTTDAWPVTENRVTNAWTGA